MADEIDIEEHDIMENPIIKHKFPDLSVIKNEYVDNEFESTPCLKQREGLFRDFKPHQPLGHPSIDPICKAQSTEIIATASLTPDARSPDCSHLQCNKIILGSKPNRVSIDQNYFEKCVKPYQAMVVLQDIQSYLQKSKRYCESCCILFPEPRDYEDHLEVFHPRKYITDFSQNKIMIRRSSKHRCNECTTFFATSFLLKKHLKNSHNTNSVDNSNIGIESGKRYNRSLKKNYSNYSDLTNICFHCKETFNTQKLLIEHLYDVLQMKKKQSDIIPVLKSVLFKCNKCDINFVSSQVAASHSDHMEMLINWKCSICYRIFKKEDELSHERQHSVSNNFIIYNLGEVDVKRFLFRCSKCFTHFTEDKFLYHFRDCGLKTSKSEYCKICDILLETELKISHDSDHNNTDLSINHFTLIETEVISDNPVKVPTKGIHTKKINDKMVETFSEVKIVLQRLDTNELLTYTTSNRENKFESDSRLKSYKPKPLKFKSDVVDNNDLQKKKSQKRLTIKKKQKDTNTGKSNGVNPEIESNIIERKRPASLDDNPIVHKIPNLAYSYCETCKCFLTKFRTSIHKQSRCTNFVKHACKVCGLTFTKMSLLTHKKLHETRKYLKLKNFKFYNLYNGRPMNPPIPEYPKCDVCKVHFLTKIAKNNHGCSEEAYLTCLICEMKLSEAAFKVHMMFHHYSTDCSKTATSMYVQSKINMGSEGNVGNAKEKETTLQKSQSNKCDKTVLNTFATTGIAVTGGERVESPSDFFDVLYTCRNCFVTVDTYDRVVEHCQGHYNIELKEIETDTCHVCTLKIDKRFYTEHHHLHENGNRYKVLKFDSYYFPAENDMWLKHVFKSLPKDKVLEILKKSIYRFEGRIKMDVIQQGAPDLTVYKCEQCSCFIEPTTLFKHADNSCFKLRKHPCTFCGLPFISSTSRTNHEKIHKHSGITLKSYRIVVFNREQDKVLNSSFCFHKRYVLYQCRNCGGIIDKLQADIHECDTSDLKRCPDCALLLYSKEYEAHATKHKEFDSFNHINMKVILLGDSESVDRTVEKTLRSNFQGIIHDYKMYRCNNCQLCIKNESYIPKHSCYFGKPHSKCPKCSLYFSVSRLKTHLRYHERDSDFLRSNMSIVSFDPFSLDQNKNTTAKPQASGDCELTDSNSDSDSDIVMKGEERSKHSNEDLTCEKTEVVEEIVKVYKCACGLHFLNEDSILRHFGVCSSKLRSSKQNCPKCDLLFTSNVLFTHLLAHHGNKNHCYKYDIIEMKNKYHINNTSMEKVTF